MGKPIVEGVMTKSGGRGDDGQWQVAFKVFIGEKCKRNNQFYVSLIMQALEIHSYITGFYVM